MSIKKEDPQILIADLCERFTKIFQEIKDIKESRQSLERENQELTYLINEEILNHQKSIDNIQKEILESQEVKEKEIGLYDLNPNIEKEIHAFSSEIENQKIMISLIEKKRLEVLEKTNVLKKIKSDLIEKSKKYASDIESQKNMLDKIKNITEELYKKKDEFQSNSRELQIKYDRLLSDFMGNETLYKESIEEKMKKEDEHKTVSTEYREILKKNSNFSKTVQETEKEINKSSDDLKAKIQRLEVLLKMNSKLSNKLLKLEEESLIYEKVLEENKRLQHNIQVLQEKIEILTNQSLNFNFKVQIKKLLNQINNKTKNLSTNFSNLKNIVNIDEKNLLKNQEDDFEEIIKQNIYLEEYIKSLENATLQQNNQIYENKKKINEQEEKLKEVKEVLFGNKIDKDNLEKKFELMKERMQSYPKKSNLIEENA